MEEKRTTYDNVAGVAGVDRDAVREKIHHSRSQHVTRWDVFNQFSHEETLYHAHTVSR